MRDLLAVLKELVPPQLYPLLGSYWYKNAVGGLWEEMGQWQFDYLIGQGLKPGHYFLDVGCGSLRGGVRFVRYLEPNHYFGVDTDRGLLRGGRAELEKRDLLSKSPCLAHITDFSFQRLNQQFDYALAQSVFSHLPLNNIIRCLMNVERVLRPGGKFYATFFENPEGKYNLEPITHLRRNGETSLSYFDQDAYHGRDAYHHDYHYNFDTFEWACEGTSLKPTYIGECAHPRDQQMLLFTKT